MKVNRWYAELNGDYRVAWYPGCLVTPSAIQSVFVMERIVPTDAYVPCPLLRYRENQLTSRNANLSSIAPSGIVAWEIPPV